MHFVTQAKQAKLKITINIAEHLISMVDLHLQICPLLLDDAGPGFVIKRHSGIAAINASEGSRR